MERRFAQLKRLSVLADEAIVWEGEPGEECYLLRRGRAEVGSSRERGAGSAAWQRSGLPPSWERQPY